MSRRGLQGRAAELLYGAETGDRYVDMAIDLREWDGMTSILEVGGRWDRQEHDWIGDAATRAIWRVQPAQYEAAYWLRDWLQAYAEGQRMSDFGDVYALICEGGRAAGKSDFGVRALAIFAIAIRQRITWALSPVIEESDELRRVFESLLLPSWYQWLKSEKTWRLWNGSEIQLISGYNPSSLKRGRVDMWLMNEGQRFAKDAYLMARPRLSDTSGLGLITANPPREAKGRWILDFHDQAQAGTLPDVHLIEFDNRKNPTIDWRSLELLKDGFGDRDYRREVLGEFIPIGDTVFYAWSPNRQGNIRPRPEMGCTTRQITRKHLGREFDHVLGVDFQISPHMAALIAEFFHNEEDPADPLMWFTDEAVVEGTEDDLLDLLELKGYHPDSTAVIADASGEWQDAERTKGKGSYDIFRRRGWKFIYTPDRKMKRNPIVIERVQATNARMCSAREGPNGKKYRRMFAVPDLYHWNTAAKSWANRSGVPHKRSEYAHICDAGSYIVWRFFPRKHVKRLIEYRRIERTKSVRERDLGRF